MAAGTVQIDVLGGFEVRLDRGVVGADRWPTRRSAELVQLLTISPGHRLLRDQVIEAMWPQLDPLAGAANLRKAAHHARRALDDPEAVTLHRGQVWLFPSREVVTDIALLESAARQALARSDEAAARTLTNEWAGDLLPSNLYDDWTQTPRRALHILLADLLRLGKDWDRLVDLDPTDEEACRAVMRRCLASGRRHAAISAYGRLRTALRTELGVAPEAESEAVYADCVRGMSRESSAFVGRESELSTVLSRLRSGPRGPHLVVVRGPAGSGKSAVVRQISAMAQHEGWRSALATAAVAEGPYAALTTVVEHVVAADPHALRRAGIHAQTVLAELSPMIETTSTLDLPLTRHQVIGAVRRLAATTADGRGTVIVIDDAHAADAATIEVLLHLGAVISAPVLVVLAYRPEAASEVLHRGVARLLRAHETLEIDLGPLSAQEARALAVSTGLGATDPTLDELVTLAAGSPFFVLELARGALAGGQPRVAPSRSRAIATRFADLDDATMALLRRLALADCDLDLPIVLAFTGCVEDEAFGVLDDALESGLLVVVDGRYRFSHDLMRQAMVEAIAPHHRIAIHRDAARRLAELGVPSPLVARHWLAGGRPDLAAPALFAAARRAVDLAAFRDALAYLDTLLQHDPSHLDGLLLRAESLEALGQSAALAAYAAAARAAGETAAHEIVPRQALAQIKQGDPAGALRTIEPVSPVTVAGRLAQALTLSGAAALGFGNPAIGAEKAAESRRLALETGDAASLVIASWANAAAAHARGELRESVRIDLDDTHDLPRLAVQVFDGQLCITQRLLYGARPYDDVIAFADSLGSQAQRIGAARGYAFARTMGGEAKLLAGRLDEADHDLSAALQLHRAISASTGESFSLQRRAEVALHRGHSTEARSMLDEALAVAQASEVGFHLFDRIYGARIAAADSIEGGLAALEEAEEAVLGPAETCPGCRITLSVPAAIAAARAGDLARASVYERSTVFLAEVVMRLPAWYAALDEVRGHLAHASGDSATGQTHFVRAAEVFRRAGQPLDEARCRERALSGP